MSSPNLFSLVCVGKIVEGNLNNILTDDVININIDANFEVVRERSLKQECSEGFFLEGQ